MTQHKKTLLSSGIIILLLMFSLSVHAQSLNSDQASSRMFTGESLFNKASFIMDFSYIYRDATEEELKSFQIPMFIEPDTLEYPKSGLNLNYGELSISPTIDDNYKLFFDIIFTKDDITIDEMYVDSTDLPFGFRFKVGRFLSSFGWHNQFHKHQWNFFDAPLIQSVFFGEDGLIEDTIMLGWEVPVDFDFLIGFEVGRGENEKSFGTESFGTPELGVKKSENPNLYTFFIDSTVAASSLEIAWGLSLAGGLARIDENLQTNSGSGIDGQTIMGGFNFNVRYRFDRFTYIMWQNEFMARQLKGDYFIGEAGGITTHDIIKSQMGGYSQLVIKPFAYWRFGARAEFLQNNIKVDKVPAADVPKNLMKYSGMIDLNTTEYAQIRLQYNYNKEFYTDEDIPVDVSEVILQFNFSFGPHGAHLI